MQVIIIILLILAVLLVVFTLQNSIEITITFFLWEIKDAPLVLVLLGCLLIGYILASIYFYPRLWKLKREYKHLLKFKEDHSKLQEKDRREEEPPANPEGIELDDNDDNSSIFFKD